MIIPIVIQSEVTDINKQKFLAELAKLLTFMYEEDRQMALAAYTDMFDEAKDEQALIQALVSPLRQAVVVAHAYNAGDRKLQTRSVSREEEGEAAQGGNEFMRKIFDIRNEVLGVQYAEEAEEVDVNQISLFEPLEEQPVPPAEASQPESAAEPEQSPEEPAQAPVEQPPEPAEEQPAPQEDGEADKVGAFMADFSLPEEVAESQPAPVEEPAAEEPAGQDEPLVLQVEDGEKKTPAPAKTVRKARVPLLILYILLAIPVTLIGIALLLIPTLLSLSASILCISLGVLAVSSAFGNFAMLANLLVVLGAALISLALGLLFLWIFIWLIAGAIGGLVRGVFALGRKWCYKEVPAE